MNIDNILTAMKKFNPMAVFEDLGIVTDILQYTQPKTILELGTGNGGWILSVDYILPGNITFIGYEDFRLNYGRDWENNVDDLYVYLRSQSQNCNIIIKNENVKELDTEYFKQLNIKFDVVRLDCLENREDINQLFFKIFPYTSDKCIFLVDDIVPNLCPNRFISYMDKVYDGILKPIWFGKKEGAWCKNTYNNNLLQDFILQESAGNIDVNNEKITWNSLPHRLIQSYGKTENKEIK
jgi:hypothetical protein